MSQSQTLPEEFWLSKPPKRNRHNRKSLPPATLLGARLRELRQAAGLRQHEMAAKIGYTSSGGRISDWEVGHILPTLPVLYRYGQAFGMTVSEILDGVL